MAKEAKKVNEFTTNGRVGQEKKDEIIKSGNPVIAVKKGEGRKKTYVFKNSID